MVLTLKNSNFEKKRRNGTERNETKGTSYNLCTIVRSVPLKVYPFLLLVLVVVESFRQGLAVINHPESSISYNNKKNLKQQHYPCGDWTPRGDLGNPNYDARERQQLLKSHPDGDGFPSCLSSSKNNVGQDLDIPANELYCQPDVAAFNRSAPILALDLQLQDPSIVRPQFSIVSPSFNVESVINETTPTLCETTVGLWEVIFILDGCYDGSLQVLRDVLLSKSCLQSSMVRARVVVTPTGIYETSSDNIGYVLANPSHFYIEVQSDMFLAERGWNFDMSRPCFQYEDIFSISGRCGHKQGPGPDRYLFGRCGSNVGETSDEMKEETKDFVYVTATNNRGPLLHRADALQKLGYLDEVNFSQDDDDHDLNRRANFYGWFAGYKYVHFYSPLDISPKRHPDKYQQRIPPTIKEYDRQYRKFRKERQNKTCGADIGTPFGVFSELTPQSYELRDLPPVSALEWFVDTDVAVPLLPPLPPLPIRNITQKNR